MEIHIDRAGERYGPYSLDEVNQHLGSGLLQATDNAWHDGLAEWVPLSQMEGVRPAASGAAPSKPSKAGARSGSGKGLKVALIALGAAAVVTGIVFGVLHLTKGKGGKGGATAAGKAEWGHLPKDTDFVLRIKLGAIFNHPAVQDQLKANPQANMVLQMAEGMTGLKPSDIDSATLGIAGLGKFASAQMAGGGAPGGADFESYLAKGEGQLVLVVRTTKEVDPDKLTGMATNALAATAALQEQTHGGSKYILAKKQGEAGGAFYFPDKKTLVFGTENTVKNSIDAKGAPPALPALDFVDTSKQLCAAFAPGSAFFAKAMESAPIPPGGPPHLEAMAKSLAKLEGIAVSGSAASGLQLEVAAKFTDEPSAKALSAGITDALADPQLAGAMLMLQGMGITPPKPEQKGAVTKLALMIPEQAMAQLAQMGSGMAGIPNGGNTGGNPVTSIPSPVGPPSKGRPQPIGIPSTKGGTGTNPGTNPGTTPPSNSGPHTERTVKLWTTLAQLAAAANPQQPWSTTAQAFQQTFGAPEGQEVVLLQANRFNATIKGQLHHPKASPAELKSGTIQTVCHLYRNGGQGIIRLYFRQNVLVAFEWDESAAGQKVGPPKLEGLQKQ